MAWILLWVGCASPVSGGAVSGGLEGLASPQVGERQRAAAPYVEIAPGQVLTLLDTPEAGRIVGVWMTFAVEGDSSRMLRQPSLRMYWDGEASPAVQVPAGDFFGLGHGEPGDISSLPVTTSQTGLSCAWPMPFARGARITLTNDGAAPLRVYYQIDWVKLPRREVEPYRFQASWRRDPATTKGVPFEIASIQGEGHLVGTVLSIDPHQPGWWGEGDDLVWVDGSLEPSLRGTGTEDWIRQAWGVRPGSTATAGAVEQKGRHVSLYRWYLYDPIPFHESLRVAMQQEGPANVLRSDDVSATALWYQAPPLTPLPALPPFSERIPPASPAPEAWSLPRPAVPIPLGAATNASRFHDNHCAPLTRHAYHAPPGPARIAGVDAVLLPDCQGEPSAVLLLPGQPVRLSAPASERLFLFVAAMSSQKDPRGGEALRVEQPASGWSAPLVFGRELDPFEDAWAVPNGKLVLMGERGVNILGGYMVSIPGPPSAGELQLTAAPGVTASLFAVSGVPLVAGPAATQTAP